jgi:tRNA-2-methylthio-N6-dimethylallyladenosine synthase
VEGPSKAAHQTDARPGPVQLTGRTPTDHIVAFDGNPRLIGETIQVLIEEASAFTLFGRTVIREQIGVVAEALNASPQRELAAHGRMSLPLI